MRYTMIAALLLLAACGDARKSFEDGFKTSFEKSFAESCVKGAMESGAPAEKQPQIAEICGCVAKKLVSQHSVTELASMGNGSNQDKVQAAVQECKPM